MSAFVQGELYVISQNIRDSHLARYAFLQTYEEDGVYHLSWTQQQEQFIYLKPGDILLCLDNEPKNILFKNKNTSFLQGKTIGFLYKNLIVVPWYSYVYEHNASEILSRHIIPL